MKTRRKTLTLAILAILAWTVAAAPQAAKNLPPVARFAAFLASDGRGAIVEFDATGSSDPDGQVVSYQWLFGDGTTGSGAVREHAYSRPDRYTVTLLVIDNAGGTAMTTRTVDLDMLSPRRAGTASSPVPAATAAASTAPTGNRVGQKAPEFSLPGNDDSIVRLSDHLGQVVVLEFWMSACPGCQASMSHLETLRVRYEAQGLVVILVSIDATAAGATDFLRTAGYSDFVSTLDIYWPTRPTRTAYGVGDVPHTFLIDRTGVIRYSGSPGGLTPAIVEGWI